jgi:hypothetical protein
MEWFDTEILKTGPYAYKTPREKFWLFVNKNANNGCWEWTGKLYRNGYGNFQFKGISYLAHRISYKLEYGQIENNLFALHKCDNRKCINPEHLFLGTHIDNMKDMTNKNRQADFKGVQKYNSKLNDDAVIYIRNNYIPFKNMAKDLAEKYGVSTQIIYNVANGNIWKHVIPHNYFESDNYKLINKNQKDKENL